MIELWHLAALLPPLLLLEGFFSGSEIALLSADKVHLKTLVKQGSTAAKLALELANHPERVLSTTLFVTISCVVGISALVTLYLNGQDHPRADLMAILLTSPLVVVFGELLPKAIYQRHANRLVTWVARPVHLTYWIFLPATFLLSFYTTRLSRLTGPIQELISGKRRTTRDEIRSMLTFSRRESELKTSEKKIIKRIFDFSNAEAKHALIPLVKVDAIEESSTLREALELFESHRHSRMPVFRDRIDNIVGVLNAKDLLAGHDPAQPIRPFLRPAHYVAETQALEDLMVEMHEERNEMAVIVDEYGGAVGILTFEDIIEEIVGEIDDEYDATESTLFKELAAETWQVQAKIAIQQLNEGLGLDIPEGDYETLGGFLLHQFGRIPDTGDELIFETGRDGRKSTLRFTVKKATERQIETVVVNRLPNPN